MRGITEFLEKFKHLLHSDAALKQKVSDAVYSVIGARIDPKQIEIRERTATVRGSAVLRSELMLKKSLIIEELRRFDPTSPISDLR